MNTASVEAGVASEPRRGAAFDRTLVFVPAAFAALALLTLYFVEAWVRKTPWVFTDELEWSQISRAINATGHPARRGQHVNFKSIYAYLIAPCWWIHSTATAYAVIKYLNAVVMALAAVPTFLLARMLVSRRTAAVVAVLSVLIPGMSYAASIVPEVLAYPWYALCSWLIVRALTRKGRGMVLLAVAASLIAITVRSPQFFTVPASFAIAAAALWVTGPRGRAMRASWSRSDTLGAITLLVGALMLFNRVVLQHVHEWQSSTEFGKARMVDLGLKAAQALVIGMGILPLLGGLASLHLPERRGAPAYRAFAAYLASSILCISLYTAVKATALSAVFATLIEERNMIYLSPLLLLGTALVFEARRIDWRIVAAGTAFVVFLVLAKQPNLYWPYFEAPGFAILHIPKEHLGWGMPGLRAALLVVVGLSVLALVFRRARGVAPAVAVLGAAWMLTAEISATTASVVYANRFLDNLPTHLDWIDRATNRQPTTYLGQFADVDPDGIWFTEFWNRGVQRVDTLDGSGPGPGPSFMPSLVRADGLLSGLGDVPYVVSDNGVTLQGTVVARGTPTQLVLYQRHGPWRLLDEEQQVYTDGWAPGWATYTYFKSGRRGTLVMQLGRQGYSGDAPPGRASIAAGTVRIEDGVPKLAKTTFRLSTLVRNGPQNVQTIRIPVERTPVRVVLSIPNTFQASTSDRRQLGAQVSFRFVPAR
jgi:hypothetical protein